MSQCCTSSGPAQAHPGKYVCPVNGKPYTRVSSTTILHHINEPWRWHKKQQGYYFCEDPDCDVVYFGQDGSVIYKSALRTKVGVKEKSDDSLLCYCFGVSKRAADQKTKTFVLDSTKQQACACKHRNPSGRCCLKDFP